MNNNKNTPIAVFLKFEGRIPGLAWGSGNAGGHGVGEGERERTVGEGKGAVRTHGTETWSYGLEGRATHRGASLYGCQ